MNEEERCFVFDRRTRTGMTEKQKVMERLASTKTALELEKHAKLEEKAEMMGKELDPTLSKISAVTEMTGVARVA